MALEGGRKKGGQTPLFSLLFLFFFLFLILFIFLFFFLLLFLSSPSSSEGPLSFLSNFENQKEMGEGFKYYMRMAQW